MKSIFLCLVLASTSLFAQTVSELYPRGYTLIPEPRKVTLKDADFVLDSGWRIVAGSGVRAGGVAIETLRDELSRRYQLTLAGAQEGRAIELIIRPGSVEIGAATDPDRAAVAAQAYRIELSPGGIRILANAEAGLFYGAETFIQLVKQEFGRLLVPEGEILDWPDLSYRELFWDEQEHLDHLDVLKQAVRRAAFFKANALSLRLNQYFEYASAPALVAPYALKPSELQELTDYGLRHHVQVVPYLDGPAHANFILDHDEYKHLREYPNVTFQMCASNPETYRLLEGMMGDLINANKGVSYFHLSTDEAWFIGQANNEQCHESQRANELGGPSKLLVDFINKTAGYLESRGRKVIFWGEHPLQAEDIHLLSPTLINGEIYSADYNKAFREHGISQMIYTNTQPNDALFPVHSVLSPHEKVHGEAAKNRAEEAFKAISFSTGREQSRVVGADIYAWGDTGPHPETFWLGYAVAASAAWNPGASAPRQLEHSFYRLYYGRGSESMDRLYQLLSTQAQFYGSSWDRVPSGTRPLVFGYSYGIGPFTPHISTLPLPPIPTPDYLRLSSDWSRDNARRVELAWKALGENDELLDLIYRNLRTVEFNRYNLEVYLRLAQVARHNLTLFHTLDEISAHLRTAAAQANQLHYAPAVAALDNALDAAYRIRDDRNQVLQDLTATWYKTWFPRVREANGRHAPRAPHIFVDTDTSESAKRRQEGMRYVMEREFALPLSEWVGEVQKVRNQYAASHQLPMREDQFDWNDITTMRSSGVERDL